MARDIDIYCILCPSFHGSTLLSLILGNHRQVLGLGDTIPNDVFPTVCGCGTKFNECDFWTDVRDSVQWRNGRELFPATVAVLGNRYLNFGAIVALGGVFGLLGLKFPRKRFARSFEKFLRVCSEYSQFDIFVDGFKRPDHYVALKSSGFAVKGVIHLIRDPRAFVAAAKRAGVPVAQAARWWCRYHRAIRFITWLTGERVFRLRYEDLCNAPDSELEKLQLWLGIRPEAIRRPIADSVHWLGNISMTEFDGRIELRNKWPQELTQGERMRVENITARVARSFGYRFHRKRSSPVPSVFNGHARD
jgi:hypothetical protein